MNTKVCNTCNQNKDVRFFYKYKNGNPVGICKECKSLYQKEHHTQVLEKNKKWREKNKEYVKNFKKEWYQLKEKINRRNRYKTNKSFQESYIKSSYEYRHNPKNGEKLKQFRKTFKEKHRNDPRYNTVNNLRRRLKHLLKGTQKSANTLSLVGCNRDKLVSHLESLFRPGMSWNNYGFAGWHIDHIQPCDSFDLTNPNEQKKCFHYSNLQPLWWHENLKKGNKILLSEIEYQTI